MPSRRVTSVASLRACRERTIVQPSFPSSIHLSLGGGFTECPMARWHGNGDPPPSPPPQGVAPTETVYTLDGRTPDGGMDAMVVIAMQPAFEQAVPGLVGEIGTVIGPLLQQ